MVEAEGRAGLPLTMAYISGGGHGDFVRGMPPVALTHQEALTHPAWDTTRESGIF